MVKQVKKVARYKEPVKSDHMATHMFTPPPFRYALGIVLGIEFLLLIWALSHQFIPSPGWRSFAFYSNLILCGICLALFVFAFRLNPNRYGSKFKLAFLVISLPVLIYFWGYFALTFGAGDLLTHLLGKPAMMTDVLTKNTNDDERFKKEYIAKGVYEKRYFDNRKGCITRLSSDTLKNALPVHLCVSGQDFAKLPNHVAVNIYGFQSKVGFDIESIEYDWLKTSFLPTDIENGM